MIIFHNMARVNGDFEKFKKIAEELGFEIDETQELGSVIQAYSEATQGRFWIEFEPDEG